MKIIPLFKCRDLRQAVGFYTNVVDFKLKYPEATADDGVIDLISEFGELQLTVYENDRLFGLMMWTACLNIIFPVDWIFQAKKGHPFTRGLLTKPGERANFMSRILMVILYAFASHNGNAY